MLARWVLAMVAQLRFGHAAIIATLSADIALAGVYLQLRDIEQGYTLSFLLQVARDSARELCGLRNIPGVFSVPSARDQQQDIILRFEMPVEPRARID